MTTERYRWPAADPYYAQAEDREWALLHGEEQPAPAITQTTVNEDRNSSHETTQLTHTTAAHRLVSHGVILERLTRSL